ncbi:MAG: hypothetical protein ACR2QS_11665 [Woeseiaceae bacterium]
MSASKEVGEDDKPFLLHYPNLDDPEGIVVFSNDYVVLQRLIVGPGEWEGVHSHPGNQVYVHIHGGEWTGRLGDQYEYFEEISPDGEVGWMDAIPIEVEHDSGNTGDTPIDLIYVTLKTDAPIAPDANHARQQYPCVPLRLEIENDRIIVQRGFVEPGRWTGVHAHPGNQVYIQINGGHWSKRRNGGPVTPAEYIHAGGVCWIDAVGANAGHEFGNTGAETIEFVLVTIK